MLSLCGKLALSCQKNQERFGTLTTSMLALLAGALLVGQTGSVPVIPTPMEVTRKPGAFELLPSTVIVAEPGAQPVAEQFSDFLRTPTGYPISQSATKPASDYIEFDLKPDLKWLGDEGYRITIRPQFISIRAYTSAGLFYGTQTLRQMLPLAVESDRHTAQNWTLPSLDITDIPRFSWRGLMLDESRHFFGKAHVKKMLDTMAMHKLNRFHWHLVDDGGWRIEIKKYPDLTRVGAWRIGDGKGWSMPDIFFNQNDGVYDVYGGFYTQEDIKEIVQYASERFITIVPEIEMPGHSLPALWTHRHLACSPDAVNAVLPSLSTQFVNTYCAGKEETFTFLGDVLSEVAGLFPGKWIHIGADEVDSRVWERCSDCQAKMERDRLNGTGELYEAFIRRANAQVRGLGKTMIGWDEIAEQEIPAEAVVMSWRSMEGGTKAIRAGNQAVMSPTSHCYFDYPYESIPTSKVYEFDPVPKGTPPDVALRVLGGQGNLWTEWMETGSDVERMAFPRAVALSEALWSPLAKKNWPDFERRWQQMRERYDVLGINYYLPAPEVPLDFVMFKDVTTVDLGKPSGDDRLVYTTDGSQPTAASEEFGRPFAITGPTEVRVAIATRLGRVGSSRVVRYQPQPSPYVGALLPGLQAFFIAGEFDKLPSFEGGTTASAIAQVKMPDILATPLRDNFAAQFTGFIKVPSTGVYTFYLTSDDGSRLLLDSVEAINNDGLHMAVTKEATCFLLDGLLPITVEYFERTGGNALRLEVSGPGLRRQTVPESWWYFAKPGTQPAEPPSGPRTNGERMNIGSLVGGFLR